LREACQKLGVVSLPGVEQEADGTGEPGLATGVGGALTTRERHLWAVAAAVGRSLAGSDGGSLEVIDACRRLIGLHIAYTHAPADLLALDGARIPCFGRPGHATTRGHRTPGAEAPATTHLALPA
jgi:hypothetical protein